MQHTRLVRHRLRHETIVETFEKVNGVVLVVDPLALYSPADVDELLFAYAALSVGVFSPLETYALCDGGPTCLTNLHFAVFDTREFDFMRFMLVPHLSLDFAICYGLRGLVPVRTQARWITSERPPAAETVYPTSFERIEDEQT